MSIPKNPNENMVPVIVAKSTAFELGSPYNR
jgi:hypothetical protein